MFLIAKIWSVHPLVFRNPACSCLSFLSIAVSLLRRRIIQNTLLGMEKSVIPRQFSHTWWLPFLGSCTLSPLPQSLGIVSLSQNWLEQFSQDSGSCADIGFHNVSMNGVYAWGVPTRHSFDGVFDFRFCWGSCVDFEVTWRWWGIGALNWLGVVRDFTRVHSPFIGLAIPFRL